MQVARLCESNKLKFIGKHQGIAQIVHTKPVLDFFDMVVYGVV